MEPDTPSSPSDWKILAEQENITGLSIHDEEVPSGSKFELRHYLLLRILWKYINPRARDFDPEMFGLDTWINQANDMLSADGYHWWNVYCDSLDRGEPVEGNFFVAKLFQDEAAAVSDQAVENDVVFSGPQNTRAKARRQWQEARDATMASFSSLTQLSSDNGDPDDIEVYPSDPPEWDASVGSPGPPELWNQMYPRAQGEATVNAALVSFLKAITAHFNLSSDWTMHQKAFKAEFTNSNYEARVDGYLKGIHDNDVHGLIEVKPVFRPMKLLEIRIQESAQNVAWLMEDSEAPKDYHGRRFHVSQDRHEIWVVFTVYGEKYWRFLSGEHISPDDPESYSTMYEVGPFSTANSSHMRNLGPLVLALALRADHDREREREDAQAEREQEDTEMGERDSEIDTESSQDSLPE